MVKAPLPIPYRLLASTLTAKSPSSNGVPEITPLEASNASPAGSPDTPTHSGALTGTTR